LHAITGTTTITLFVISIAVAVTNFTFALFILPESLPPSRRLSRVPSFVDDHPQQRRKGIFRRIVKTLRNVASQFLRPATLFIPLKLEVGRDWNLTLTGAALFLYVFADVSHIREYNAWADILYLASV
jgi:hypothetical protein